MTAQTATITLSDETATMIDANLELSRRFFAAAFDDPSLLDDLPADATVVLIPFDDPGLARANMVAAEREASLGKRVVLRIVGLPSTERSEWDTNKVEQIQFTTLRPRWPDHAESTHAAIHYFQDTDALVIRFYDDDRTGAPVPWRGPTYLLVDIQSQDVLGYLLPNFVGSIVGAAPQLGSWLQQAKLHEQTPERVRLLLHDVPEETDSEPTVAGVREGIGDLALAG